LKKKLSDMWSKDWKVYILTKHTVRLDFHVDCG